MKTTTAQTILGTALVAATLALTSCTGGSTPNESPSPSTTATTQSPSATPTPTATSTAIAAPTSEDQALKDAMIAVTAYGRALEETSQAKSVDTSKLRPVSKGAALKFAEDFVAAAAKDPTKYTGTTKVAFQDGYASNLTVGEQKFEFGFADLSVCEDSSQVKGVLADGSPAPKADHPKVLMQYTVEYDPAAKTWIVASISQGAVVPC